MVPKHRLIVATDGRVFDSVGVLVMPHQVLVDELLPMFPADATMHPQLGLDVREDTFKTVVRVLDTEFQMVIESPQ